MDELTRIAHQMLSHIDFSRIAEDERRNEKWRNSAAGKKAIEEYWKIARGEISADSKWAWQKGGYEDDKRKNKK